MGIRLHHSASKLFHRHLHVPVVSDDQQRQAASSALLSDRIKLGLSVCKTENPPFLFSTARGATKILSSQATKLFLGESVPVFVVLGNWTDEGLKNAKDAPSRIKDTHNAVEKAGGKMQLYYTLGEYDFIMVLEMPDEKAIMRILLWLGSKGNVRTKTLKAWTEAEAAKEISQMQ